MIKKRAVLVAVGDYQNFAETLESPKYDILLWKSIFDGMGFDVREPRIDAGARRAVVEADLKWLVDGARKDDQLFLVFLGHGRMVEAASGASRPYEPALIVYPEGDRTLKRCQFTETDLDQIIGTLEKGVDATIIRDCCFVDDYEPTPPGAKRLAIAASFSTFGLRADEIRRSGSFVRGVPGGTDTTATDGELPLYLDACDVFETAYEAPVDGTPHMLFTFAATRYLNNAAAQMKQVTFQMLIRDIYPLAEGYSQRPVLGGNVDRGTEPFPGKPDAIAAFAARRKSHW